MTSRGPYLLVFIVNSGSLCSPPPFVMSSFVGDLLDFRPVNVSLVSSPSGEGSPLEFWPFATLKSCLSRFVRSPDSEPPGPPASPMPYHSTAPFRVPVVIRPLTKPRSLRRPPKRLWDSGRSPFSSHQSL